MTEKEKRDRGFLYNANYDEEILNEINRCNDFCHEFNQIKPSDRESQSAGRIIAKVVLSILQLSPQKQSHIRLFTVNHYLLCHSAPITQNELGTHKFVYIVQNKPNINLVFPYNATIKRI